MDDLDSLLSDLGKRRDDNSSTRKTRPPTSRVDLNELASLMEVLAAPTPQQAETKQAAPSRSARETTTVDDLDALMESLSAASGNNNRGTQRIGTTSAKQMGNVSAYAEPVVESASTYNSLRSPDLSNPAYQSRPVSTVYNSPGLESRSGGYVPAASASHNDNSYQSSPYSPNSASAYNSRPVTSVYSGGVDHTPPAYNAPPNYAGHRESQNLGGPAPGVRKPDELDALLNNLHSQMDNIAAVQSSLPPAEAGGSGSGGKQICRTCQQPIYGEVIQALRASYHPEHFACGSCRSPIGTGLFFEHNGAATCERCYKEMCCPKCAHCDKPITDRCVTAIGKKWHADHFICTQCLRPFENGVFFEREGRPYCEADFYNVFAPKCAGCSEPVRGDCITALGSQWHPEHFECNFCRKSLVNSTFFEYGGKPFCEAHYHMQSGSVCGGCGKVIVGRSITAFGKKWHPEEFVCAFCAFPLSGGSYTEHNAKPYCKECHSTLFG